MPEHIKKSHNKTLLMYHIVCPAKYRRTIFSKEVEGSLREICLNIEIGYELKFLEIGADKNHVHFLVQSVPSYSVSKIAKIIKGITARELFKNHPEIKKSLWGGNLWTSGYYANTVGHYGNLDLIKNYVKKQGEQYTQIYKDQISLFDL